jgi:abequosyltransferase
VTETRKLFSVCIPAYNRARHLSDLLESIFSQDFQDFEIVICEDFSPEREEIGRIVREYQSRYRDVVRYFENEQNFGYDRNIRNLVEKASGEFCFFMGNDDLMCQGALENAADVVRRHPNAGLILKSYGLFNETPQKVSQEIRWFKEEKEFPAGSPAIRFAFRRSGVIAGYIVHRDSADEAATGKFDGTLFYQMHLTATVLVNKTAVFTPRVLVLCRESAPEFGISETEKGKYVPGGYTPQARLNMVGGALSIIRDLKEARGIDVVDDVVHDYANYFYPYIRDQLNLPLKEYYALYRAFGRMGFSKYPLYHVYFLLGYVLGQKNFDALTALIRQWLGRSPRFGIS